MKFDQEAFNRFVDYHNVIKFERMPLSSERISNYDINWRNILKDVYLTDMLTDFVIAYAETQGLWPDTFYGVKGGASKLGILTQDKWARKSVYFGVGSHVSGIPRGKTIILGDVIATGDSLIEEIFRLRESKDSVIIAAFGLTNRNERRNDRTTVREALEKIGVPFYYLSNAFDLLPLAYQKQKPGEKIAGAIKREFEIYGERPLRLLKKDSN